MKTQSFPVGHAPTATYRPRHPERTPFYQCLQDYWDEFKQGYPYFYEAEYGPWRPVVEKTVDRFLECGLLRHGFARLKCGRCSHQALLAFSCKTRILTMCTFVHMIS